MSMEQLTNCCHFFRSHPHTFKVEDLYKLILSPTKDLELLDEKRREDFKEYEMKKELDYKASLTKLNETERLQAIATHDEQIKKHKDHPRVHHPGSKAQLEQVWEEQDHMPKQEFDPKTFFAMHDISRDSAGKLREILLSEQGKREGKGIDFVSLSDCYSIFTGNQMKSIKTLNYVELIWYWYQNAISYPRTTHVKRNITLHN